MLLPFPLLAPWSLLLKIALEELAKVFNPALPLMERRSRPGDAGASGELIVTDPIHPSIHPTIHPTKQTKQTKTTKTVLKQRPGRHTTDMNLFDENEFVTRVTWCPAPTHCLCVWKQLIIG